MKYLSKILGIALLVFLIMGCGKDDDNPNDRFNYFMTFKVDGTPVEFKGLPVGAVGNGPVYNTQVHSFVMSGDKDYTSQDGRNYLFLSFIQESRELLVGHDYRFDYAAIAQDFDDNLQAWALATSGFLMYYMDDTGVEYTAAPQKDFENFKKQTRYAVRFTSRSADAVEGVFSAKLYNRDLDKFIDITEGKFRLLNALDKN